MSLIIMEIVIYFCLGILIEYRSMPPEIRLIIDDTPLFRLIKFIRRFIT